jgi:hypothetical protein
MKAPRKPRFDVAALRAAKQVDFHIGAGGNARYETACRLIARMAGLRDPAAQAQYVATLKQRHRLKRNFIKLLG